MAHILITGGNGHLGRALTPRLRDAGHTVRILSRSPRPAKARDIEWAQASLDTGEGLDQALAGMDTIIHAATNAADARNVDVEGTRRLLDAAQRSRIGHVYYISIVGIDRDPLARFPYYRAKLAAERLVEASPVPWTILRAVQFHYLIDLLIGSLARLPIAFLPLDWKFQSLDTGEVAAHMVGTLAAGPSGRLPDVGGPQLMTLRQMADGWFKARGMSRPVVRLPLPFRFAQGFRLGQNTAPENPIGSITWAQWLEARYGSPTRLHTGGARA